jgi:hypothetical protein
MTLPLLQSPHRSRFTKLTMGASGFKVYKRLVAQKALVAALQTSHLHNEFTGFHDQSSSATRVATGAAGFLILTHQSLRPGRYGDPRRFDTMPSQPSAQACS